MKQPFTWDNYSDQPAQLKESTFKKQMRKKELSSLIKTVLLTIVLFPISLFAMPFVKRKEVKSEEFFCMGVDFEREEKQTLECIDELGVESVLVRFKLWEMEKLGQIESFLEKLQGKQITLKIMQDRENIEDLTLFAANLEKIFTKLHDKVTLFEIGTTINRAKWGFFSVDEYNRFFSVAYALKQEKFPDVKLIGSGVIDFEFHFTLHTLFNLFPYKYDGISSLLYVDRRGAPENTQMGFTLSDKIALLSTMVWLSRKTPNKLYITETNWPLSGTAPYAPTSEKECVSEAEYTDYMLRYHYLAFASQQVDFVSWHQLIAAGYGLIDTRKKLRKREAYDAYKYMLKTLKSAQFLRLDIKRNYYILQCWVDEQLLQIHWAKYPTTLQNEDFYDVYDKLGNKVTDEELEVGSAPLYIFITKAVSQKINCI